MLTSTVPANTAQPAPSPPTVVLGSQTWTGETRVDERVVVGPGQTLTIEDAHVVFESSPIQTSATGDPATIPGIEVEEGGQLVVQNSTLTTAPSEANETPLDRSSHPYLFKVQGQAAIEDSRLLYPYEVNLGGPGVEGSTIENTTIGYATSNGLLISNTNRTRIDGSPDVRLDGVTVHDNFGRYQTWVGGLQIMASNVDAHDVRVERGQGTGQLFLESTVFQQNTQHRSTISFEDLLVVGGTPPGISEHSSPVYARPTSNATLTCEDCSVVLPPDVGFRDSVFLDFNGDGPYPDFHFTNYTGIASDLLVYSGSKARVTVDGGALRGPSATVDVYAPQPLSRPLSIHNVSLLGEHLENDAGRLVDARSNWWGAASGPADLTPNDGSIPDTNGGIGTTVNGTVDYSEWLTEPPEPTRGLVLEPVNPWPQTQPGTSVSVSVQLTNHGPEPERVPLEIVGDVRATTDPTPLQLDPGEHATREVVVHVPADAEPGSTYLVPLLADGRADHAAHLIEIPVQPGHARVSIEDPKPLETVGTNVTLSGTVAEAPTGNAQPSTAGSSAGLASHDEDADGIDDRAEDRPGTVRVLVQHASGADGRVVDAVEQLDGEVIREFSLIDDVWIRVDSDRLERLSNHPFVEAIRWDAPLERQLAISNRGVRARTSVDATLPGGGQPQVGYEGAWSGNPVSGYEGPIGRNVTAAIIDSGIDPSHNSLDDLDDDPSTADPKVVDRINAFSVLATGAVDEAVTTPVRPGEHGTWVAGTAAGTGAAFLGPPSQPVQQASSERWPHAGAAPGLQLLDVDAFETVPDPVAPLAATAGAPTGIGLAVQSLEAVAAWNEDHPEDPARIAQISLGTGEHTTGEDPTSRAANALAETGVLVVAAVGNHHGYAVPPAVASKALAVGAVNDADTVDRSDDRPASFSDASSLRQQQADLFKPEIVAPGVSMQMPALGTGSNYSAASGTSFAAPTVTGIAALVMETNPQLHAAQVKEILIRSSTPRGGSDGGLYTDRDLDFEDDVADGGWTPSWGYGYVDAQEAVRLAREAEPRDPPQPLSTTFHATSEGLDREESQTPSASVGEGTWNTTLEEPLTVGDGDPTTLDPTPVHAEIPIAELGPTAGNYTATLAVDGQTVAKGTVNDNEILISGNLEETTIPLRLGARTIVDRAGPHADDVRVVDRYDVLDEQGVLEIAENSTLTLQVGASHAAAPGLVTTAADGTHVTLPLAPLAAETAIPPTQVGSLRATWNTTGATLNWTEAWDDRQIDAYVVERGGEEVARVPGHRTSAHDGSLSPQTTYTYAVHAVDVHGNVGPATPLEIQTPPESGRALVAATTTSTTAAVDEAGDGSYAQWQATVPDVEPGTQTVRALLFEDGELVDEDTRVVSVES